MKPCSVVSSKSILLGTLHLLGPTPQLLKTGALVYIYLRGHSSVM